MAEHVETLASIKICAEHEIRERLKSARRVVDGTLFDEVVVRRDVPTQFAAAGGICLAPADAELPYIDVDRGDTHRPLVFLGRDVMIEDIMLSGKSPCVFAERYTRFRGSISCGDGALVFIGDTTFTGIRAKIDARNGGAVLVDGDALWSIDVTVYTDDMHRITDVATGERINAFGSTVHIGRHVWLGQGALILPGTTIGNDSVVGARAVLTGSVSPNSIAVGGPARVVRSGVTWSREDLP